MSPLVLHLPRRPSQCNAWRDRRLGTTAAGGEVQTTEPATPCRRSSWRWLPAWRRPASAPSSSAPPRSPPPPLRRPRRVSPALRPTHTPTTPTSSGPAALSDDEPRPPASRPRSTQPWTAIPYVTSADARPSRAPQRARRPSRSNCTLIRPSSSRPRPRSTARASGARPRRCAAWWTTCARRRTPTSRTSSSRSAAVRARPPTAAPSLLLLSPPHPTIRSPCTLLPEPSVTSSLVLRTRSAVRRREEQGGAALRAPPGPARVPRGTGAHPPHASQQPPILLRAKLLAVARTHCCCLRPVTPARPPRESCAAPYLEIA
eukprot:COSAG04_NODE_1031_length_8627_cov_10.660765_5_plen_317_part_00